MSTVAYYTVAYYIVLFFGGLVCLASIVGLLFPKWLTDNVRSAWRMRPAMFFAVLVRVILGCTLIYYAPHSKFPVTFRVIGALGLSAAVGLPLLGWQRVDNILDWIQRRPTWLARVWLLIGVAIGALLVYGAIGP